ncbi:MAG: hypothetical protein AAFS12_18325, partial [Cyanobacteria bacterium J06632_19]
NKDSGSSWMRTLIEFMGVLGAGTGLYIQYMQVQAIQLELERTEKEKEEVVQENQKVVEENQELGKRIVKLQKPVIIDGTGKNPETDTRPIHLEVKRDLTSQKCAKSDIEIKLDHIVFQNNYRMSWVFAIKNKTSVKQKIRIGDQYTKMSLRDDQANSYPIRHVDRIYYIEPGASKNKTVQFDFPKEGAKNFNAEFSGYRRPSCFLLSPFSVNLPDKLIKSD